MILRCPTAYLMICCVAFGSGLLVAGCDGGGDVEQPDIAYVSANPPDPDYVSIQGATLEQQDWPIAEPPRPDFAHLNPQFSPDGDQIAYERRVFDDGEYVGRLFIADLEEQQRRELTDLGHDERCRLLVRNWSADGEQFGFVCDPVDNGGLRRAGVARVDGEVTLLEPSGDVEAITDVAYGDGDQLFGLAIGDDETRSLVRLNSQELEADPEVIATFDDDRFVHELQISPDGGRAAMVRATDQTQPVLRPRGSVVVVDIESGETQALLADDDGDASVGHHSLQRWHPDGNRVLVATGGYGEPPGPLRLIDVDAGNQTTLVDADELQFGTIRRADISPDGNIVVFSDNDFGDDDPRVWTQGHLYLVDTDGSNLEQLDELSVADRVNQPTFHPEL